MARVRSMRKMGMMMALFACVCLAVLLSASTFAEANRDKIAKYNARVGQKFLDENRDKEGVVVLPSGLQYKVLTPGTGTVHPRASDTVKVHYRGTLIDGKEFDSSYKRNDPTQFTVSGVIKGWTEALQRMVVGDVWELYIPADLAYGASGAGRDIGPNATLVFKVELLEIVNSDRGL